jgi:hypothetical protein
MMNLYHFQIWMVTQVLPCTILALMVMGITTVWINIWTWLQSLSLGLMFSVFRIPDVVSAGGILCFDHIPPSDIPSVVSDNAVGQNCCLALLCLKSFTICLAALIVSILQLKQMLAWKNTFLKENIADFEPARPGRYKIRLGSSSMENSNSPTASTPARPVHRKAGLIISSAGNSYLAESAPSWQRFRMTRPGSSSTENSPKVSTPGGPVCHRVD